MILSNVGEILAVTAGMNFGLIYTNFNAKTSFGYFLNLYIDHSNSRVTRKGLNSLNKFVALKAKLDYLNLIGGGTNVFLNHIETKEEKIEKLVDQFYSNTKSSLNIEYLPHISLILGLYAVSILCIIPFYETHQAHLNYSLILFNFLIAISLFISLTLECINKLIIGYRHFLSYFIFSLGLSVYCYFAFPNNIFTQALLNKYIPFSHKAIIIFPFIGILFYMAKAFIVNEILILHFKYKIARLRINKDISVFSSTIDDYANKFPGTPDLTIN